MWLSRLEACLEPLLIRTSRSDDHSLPSLGLGMSQDPSLVMDTLYLAALEDEWDDAKEIFVNYPNMVHAPLTGNGDTALHVAVRSDSLGFVEELVKVVHVTPQDLEIPNSEGNTAFCMAVISDCPIDLLKLMTGKNPKLPLIRGQDGMLPVHFAASLGHSRIADLLSSDDLLEKMEKVDTERLFFFTIRSDIYDVAIKIFDKSNIIDSDNKYWLVTARDNDQQLTALHMLARKPSHTSPYDLQRLVRRVWDRVSDLEYEELRELITKPSVVLFDAIESGNDSLAADILSNNRRLLVLQDHHGRYVSHLAALHGGIEILKYLLHRDKRMPKIKGVDNHSNNLLYRLLAALHRGVEILKYAHRHREKRIPKIRAVDNDGNNVLHLAAKYQSKEGCSTFNIKLQRELAWFQRVQAMVPQDLRKMRNNDGKTPGEIFNENHKGLFEEDKKTATDIANSGMVVAALVAGVAFAAALTVPGDMTSAWFVVFILTNTIALFASSASILSFLSIFTSPLFVENEFITFLTPIRIGLWLLIVSIAAMVISFGAASFLIFGHVFKWAAYVVLALSVLLFLLLILPSDYVYPFLISVLDRESTLTMILKMLHALNKQMMGHND